MKNIEKKIIYTINTIGPTFISKLANRILENQHDVRECVKSLVERKILERVENIMVSYKTKEDNVVIKHRNHTYYKLTKLGEKEAKSLELDNEFEIREAFKTYNKSLQNKLDNTENNKENLIFTIIDFPYSQEINVKNILGDRFESLEKTYDKTITLRGNITSSEKKSLETIPNIVII